MIWLKRAVQLNHEFLADDTVVASHHNISYYQHLLLDKAAWNNKFYLASKFKLFINKKTSTYDENTKFKTYNYAQEISNNPHPWRNPISFC